MVQIRKFDKLASVTALYPRPKDTRFYGEFDKEETIKELHNVIDDFKYEMLTRPEKIVYKESLTTPKPQVCKRCVDQMVIQAKQQALNNAQSNGMIGTLKGDINSLQGKLSGMGGNGGRSTYEDPFTGLRMYW